MEYSQEIINKIIELRRNNKSLESIGKEVGLSRKIVTKILHNNNISTERNPIIKDIFNQINTEEKAYWLGFLYADGCINSIQGQVKVGLAEIDKQHLEKLKKFLNCNNKISYNSNTKSYSLNFCCSQITNDLKRLGCIPNKSLILKFPSDQQVPPELKKHFMRGYFDGDGCLCITKKTHTISFTGTLDFINEAIKFFNWKQCKLDIAGQNYTWRCADKKKILTYIDLLYKDSSIYLNRKYKKYQEMRNYLLASIKEI